MLKFDRKDLLILLNHLRGSVDDSGGFPILENIYLDGKYAYASNKITGMRIKFNSQGIITLIPFKKFYAFIDVHGSDMVEMEIENNKLKVKIGRSRCFFIVSPVGEFPTYNKIIKLNKKGIKIGADLLKGIRLCLPFVSVNQQMQPNMNGVFVKENMVAGTDGRRIAIYRGEKSFVKGEGVIIPIELALILNKLNAIDTMYVGKKIVIKSNDIVIFSTLIDGVYPPVEKFIPKISKFIDFPAKALNDSMKKVWVFSDEGKDYTFCSIKFKKYIEVSYKGETAFIKEKVDLKGIINIKKVIKVNPYLFQSVLSACDKFAFIVDGEQNRNFIYGESEVGDFKCILMILIGNE